MTKFHLGGALRAAVLAVTLALVAGVAARPARAASVTPDIPVWANVGAWQDSTLIFKSRCAGSFKGPLAESLATRPRTITVRFLRDRRTEARPDFGGYRVYRMLNTPDSSKAVLLRRYSLNVGSELTWNMSTINPSTMNYMCKGNIVNDSVVTFVDADSTGQYVKVCRRPGTVGGRCESPGDSIFVLSAPAGPHDGFLVWYSVTIERRNTTDPDYEDLFLPDTLDNFARCGTPGARNTCPNLNHKLRNIAGPVEPTGGPTLDLQRVLAVPNPYRGSEVWDRPGQSEVHFINLPTQSRIRIYTLAGDLVRILEHSDPIHDFERWDLRNADGKPVVSGIYMYRVESGTFHYQNRLIVIR